MDRRSGIPAPSRAAGWLYALGSRVFHRAHDRGWLRVETLPRPVVSVGNLVVGGTGKTPVVLALAEACLRAGGRPAILTRGHGKRGPGGVLRGGVWAGTEPATARNAGDEPLLLSRALPGVPVVVGKNRRAGAGELLAAGENVSCFILDDGFQHRRLRRDQDLVLVDRDRPLGNGRLLPAGPLREPPSALARADHLLVTGGEEGAPLEDSAARDLDRYAPAVPRTRVVVRVGPLVSLSDGGSGPPPDCRGLPVLAVAGIARPERFRSSLERSGAVIRGWRRFRDHHPFSRDEVHAIENEARSLDAVPVTTAKDAVRLEGLVDPAADWNALTIAMEIEGGWDRFWKRIAV